MSSTESLYNYDQLAEVWNDHWGPESAMVQRRVLETIFVPQLKPGMSLLELCSASGHMSRFFSDLNLNVTGLDRSEKMIAYAKKNAPKAEFIQADMKFYESGEEFDACVCLGEAINQLPDTASFEMVVENVYASLKAGGVFLFDVSTKSPSGESGDRMKTASSSGIMCHATSEFRSDLNVTSYDYTVIKEENGRYNQSFVTVFHRALSPVSIKKILKQTGFRAVANFDATVDFGIQNHTGREYFMARK